MKTKKLKKVAAVFAVFAMMATTSVAFAQMPPVFGGENQTNVGNYANITNNVSSISSTGGNSVGNSRAEGFAMSEVGNVRNTDIDTGNANSTANSAVVANSNARAGDSYGYYGFGSRKQTNIGNTAIIRNNVSAISETGFNAVGNSRAEGFAMSEVGNVRNTDIDTGNANSTANSAVVANSNARVGGGGVGITGCCGWGRSSANQTNIRNTAIVRNNVSATSLSGGNSVGNSDASYIAASRVGNVNGTDIDTGNASSIANSVVVTNSNVRRSMMGPSLD